MGVKEEIAREAIQKIVPWWIGTIGDCDSAERKVFAGEKNSE